MTSIWILVHLGFITFLLARWGLCSFYCLQSTLECFKKDISNDLCYVSVTRVFLNFSCISHLMFDWYKLLVPVTLNWYPTYGLTTHIYVLHPPISSRYQLIWMYFLINADRVRGKLMSILETVSSSDQVVSDLFIATSNFSGSRLFTRNFQINVNIHVGNLPQF